MQCALAVAVAGGSAAPSNTRSGLPPSPNIRLSTQLPFKHVRMQVAERMGDAVRILKIDTDKNPDISTQLQARGCWACLLKFVSG